MHSTDQATAFTGLEIAIVGMAGRFPGAADVESFWRNIRDGVESVAFFSDAELRGRGIADDELKDPDYVKAGVPFEGFDQFDAGFFGYSPREAEHLDPQQRIFLECAWEALEHAGYAAGAESGVVGVFAGDGPNLYLLRHLLPRFGLGPGSNIADLLGLMSGNAVGSLSTRVAYKLNLRGPAINVQTACSTSLAAVHLACRSLLSQDCDMALAGGVWLNLLQAGGYRYQAGAILSPDGHCRAFDADAAGTVIGSGAGIVVLKRLEDALRDGDSIHAVIKGSAANNDGADKIGFTAPSVNGQAEVIRAAQLIASVPARTIGYVEAHGTGTTLGDPIEVAALTQAFRHDTQDRGFCAIGSVKTNVGHLDAAAGVAGLIKAAMALKHQTLPPSLHFKRPNPQIDFDGSPFHVSVEARPWPRGSAPRRAGVSSFGIGGTNVHLVLEEAPASASAPGAEAWHVLPLSGAHAAALPQLAQRLAAHLDAHPELDLADVAHTLQRGRRALPHRCAVVARDGARATELLRSPGGLLQRRGMVPEAPPEVVFLFPGGGTQHANMGAALYRGDAYFRGVVDQCCERLRPELGLDLRHCLLPGPGGEAAANAQLHDIALAQPALFVVEYAMARWWMHCGVKPALMLGHSLGEYVAACLAGVFRLEDALRIVAVRARLQQSMPSGAMLAVPAAATELAPYLRDGCDLAAVNGEQVCVLSGAADAIERAERALLAQGHLPRRLHVSIAAHSAMTEPLLARMEALVAAVPRQAPSIPFISNVTGNLITPEEATSPSYWARHLRSTVRFADGLGEVFRAPGRVLLEVGPGETLAGLARQHAMGSTAGGVYASQAHAQQQARNGEQLAQAVAGLWLAEVAVDWAAVQGHDKRRRIPLPTYPFQRSRFWIEASAGSGASQAQGGAGPFHVPVWRRSALPVPDESGGDGTGLVLLLGDDEASVAQALREHLQSLGRKVVWAGAGSGYARSGPARYTVRMDDRADLERVLRDAQDDGGAISEIYHLWSLDTGAQQAGHHAWLQRSYFSLMALVQAWDAAQDGPARRMRMTVVGSGLVGVEGADHLCPEKATLLGLAKVIGQEHPDIVCRVVDVDVDAGAAAQRPRAWLARQIVAEAQRVDETGPVAYRGMRRWLRGYDPLHLGRDTQRLQQPQQRLRRAGVYLITGGLGGVGLELARHLASKWKARLVLLGRTAFPARSAWQQLASAAGQPLALKQKAGLLLELESLGASVLTVSADVADPAQLRQALALARQHFGGLDGVIHAAGVGGGELIAQSTAALRDAVFSPKLRGTQVLLEATRDQTLDFVLFCSSVASIVGGLRRSHYAAANAYLDAVAAVESAARAYPVISVNWDTWRDVGMTVGKQVPSGVGLGGPEGALAFEAIVQGPWLPQVVVSTTDLSLRLGALDNGVLDVLGDGQAAGPGAVLHPRPPLATPYEAPEGSLETGLAALWSEALGVAPVGASDNLFELGGDSLLAIQLLGRVRKSYGVEVHPARFFRAPTILDLAQDIENQLLDEIEAAGPAAEVVESI